MKRLLTLVALELAIATLAIRGVGGDELALSPQHGILLLRNGNTIEGTITAAGDRYDVVAEGVETHVKRSDVALIARTAEECYRYKRSQIEEGRVGDHLELAEWCLRSQLLDFAQTEIADARDADAGHPKINLLQRRLELARQAPRSNGPATKPDKPGASEQLDRAARDLPPGSMEMFTTAIQPMLLNNCTRGCHGAQSAGALRLERPSINKAAPRGMTRRNLIAALGMIDRTQPERSKLLQAPLGPHGNVRLPIFNNREQSQYKQLVQWVYLVAGTKPATAERRLDQRGAPLLQTLGRPGETPAIETAKPEEEIQPATFNNGKFPSDNLEFPLENPQSVPDQPGPANQPGASFRVSNVRGQTMLRPAPKRGDPTATFTPRDPFDPELFNRRYLGQ